MKFIVIMVATLSAIYFGGNYLDEKLNAYFTERSNAEYQECVASGEKPRFCEMQKSLKIAERKGKINSFATGLLIGMIASER
jgi:hypothetical protein